MLLQLGHRLHPFLVAKETACCMPTSCGQVPAWAAFRQILHVLDRHARQAAMSGPWYRAGGTKAPQALFEQ
ncbi:hypothetical protein SAMD00023353_2601340 [Rosellinia necatrix]|uniref:Uncharacterized protein n=1 Tax=Rosellinia necatrix TaxID=77044 RepID=A0A1S8A853_ROSNE|nr:hypothetical protein SAMD00023353_2601340 [Rosellinia necatrix]